MLFPLIFAADFLQAQVFTAINLIVVSLLGLSSIAFVITIIKISNAVGSFSSGPLAARYNKPTTLYLLVVMAFAGSLVFISAGTLYPILSGALLLGIAMAAIYPVAGEIVV